MDDATSQTITTNITRVCALLSMFGCGYIIFEVFLYDKQKRQGRSCYFRLMGCMSLIEFFDALAFFLGPWATGADNWWAGSAGNHATCMMQAFFFQASIVSSLYNAALAIYYVLSIRYNWTQRKLRHQFEPWMHGIIFLISYGTAIASYFLGLYGSLGGVCYITTVPFGCKETYKYGYTDCIYGDNATLYHILFYEIWLWLSIFITAVSMCVVWSFVRRQENRNARYAPSFQTVADDNNQSGRRGRHHVNNIDRTYSKRFAIQGALYVLVFYLANLFMTIGYAIHSVTGHLNLTLILIGGTLCPLEGFLNFLVYMRPKWIRYRSERRRKSNNANHQGREDDDAAHNTPSSDTTTHTTGPGSNNDHSTDDIMVNLRLEDEEQMSLNAF